MLEVVHKNFGKKDSDESKAAEILTRKLRDIKANGSILVISNLSLPGGELVKDIDIAVVGYLQDYIIHPFSHIKDEEGNIDRLKVHSFCFTIELKRTCCEDAEFNELGEVFVNYEFKDKHPVLEQSHKQKNALRNVLMRYKHIRPWVTNLIWMQKIDETSIPSYRPGWNILFSEFDIDTLFTTAANYEILHRDRNNQNEAIIYSFHPDKFKQQLCAAFELFLNSKKPIDKLSRQKFECITNRNERVLVDKKGKLNIIKGRAGTGKTIQLIKFAYQEVVENHKRCLLLTYNHALVGDIRRIATFCDFPDGSEEAFSVKTIHSFFINIMSSNGINLESLENNFTSTYINGLKTLLEKNDIVNPYKWNYILIDEAQDCSKEEIQVWGKLYGESQIVIADGVDQFVRNIDFVSWEDVYNADAIHTQELTLSKRQKDNIVSFINNFATKTGINWYVEENNELRGGKIIITNNFDKGLIDNLKKQLLAAENSMYDMLCLSDSQNAQNIAHGLSKFGLKVYNGTTDDKDGKYPIDIEECRLYNYNSCRGIEGWVVICCFLDLLIEEKRRFAPYIAKRPFESDQDYEARKEREIYKWVLMPLSRAIDKLVIIIADKNSKFANILKDLYEEHKDYISWDIK